MRFDETPARLIQIRPRAVEDIEQYADYLEENATSEVALRFRSAIMNAIDQIGFMPGIGSLRELENTRLAGLRMWIVPGFRNHLIFYLTPEGGIEIVRVLHGAQNTEVILEDENE